MIPVRQCASVVRHNAMKRKFTLLAPKPVEPALTNNQVLAIRNSGQSASFLAKKYDVPVETIRGIQSLKTHTL